MLEGRSYVPFLHLRLAEMRALRELPVQSKNLLFPIIRLRPWLNSKSLDRAYEVIQESFGDRGFGLDLDPTKLLLGDDRQSYQEFADLFVPDNGYENYYNKVAELPYAVPVLRLINGANNHLGQQLENAANLERGLIVRVDVREVAGFDHVVQSCVNSDCESVFFVLDAWWGRDVLERAAVCAGLVQTILDADEDAEIVISASSFPNSFAGLGDRFQFSIEERLLFTEVRRQFNFGNFYYGDWGSTRPPTDPVPMTNVPRIDLASNAQWKCWRSEGGENYQEVAERVLSDPDWDGTLGIWAEYMIAATADESDPSIRSPAMAAAVRVNMHMHFQANMDSGNFAIEDSPIGEDF